MTLLITTIHHIINKLWGVVFAYKMYYVNSQKCGGGRGWYMGELWSALSFPTSAPRWAEGCASKGVVG